jgi:hypothetical protein
MNDEYIENQAFSPSCDLAPPPLPSASCLFFSVFLCVSPVELTDGRGGGGGAKSNGDEKSTL